MSNHFKLVIKDKGFIHIYRIDWGTLGNERSDQRSAIRSGKDAIEGHLGQFIFYDNFIFARQHSDMEFEINTAANGKSFVLGLKHAISFSLDQQSPQQVQYSAYVLQFLNIVVKNVLKAANFK